MRGLLLLLAIATPIVLVNPIFWWLVGTQISASPMTAIEADGTTTLSMISPKAPWPDWAVRPDDAQLTVHAWFKPTPPRPETGFGELSFPGDGRRIADAYAAKLRAEGWIVEAWRFRSVTPSMPPRQSVVCHLEARLPDGDPRTISAGFDLEPQPGRGRLQWWLGARPPWQGVKDGPC